MPLPKLSWVRSLSCYVRATMRRQQSRFVLLIVLTPQSLTVHLPQWLQSDQQADLFDNLFVRANPVFLLNVTPIMALSVSVAVSSSFETNVAERLAWLAVILDNVNLEVCAA